MKLFNHAVYIKDVGSSAPAKLLAVIHSNAVEHIPDAQVLIERMGHSVIKCLGDRPLHIYAVRQHPKEPTKKTLKV